MKPRRITVRQGTPEWHAFRREHVGSSDAPVIAGESPYRSALDLYLEKRTGEQPDVDPGTAHRFALGHAMEPVALAMYAEREGRKVRKGRVLESRDVPWLSASLDGETDGRIVEAKWATGTKFDDGIPGDVLVQVTHQMAVSGIHVADVAVLTPRDFTVHSVGFDEAFWGSIFDLECEFIGHVRRGDPPEPDGSDASRRALGRMHPQDDGTIIEADGEMAALILQVIDGKERAKALDAEVSALENALRFLIGDASGVEGSGFRVTYRKSKDSETVAWQEYASSLRAMIAEGAPGLLASADAMRGIYSGVKAGYRRLLVTRKDAEG